MPSDADKKSFDRMRLDSGARPVLVQKFPTIPDDVKKRFPSMVKFEQDIEAWRVAANKSLGGGEQ